MRVLGIDPGTEVMGYGVVWRDGSRLRHVESGVLRASGSIQERLHTLHVGLTELLAATGPEFVAMEEVFYHRNVRTAIRLGQAQALPMVAAGAAGLDIATYPPSTVKQAVVGNGRASKEQVQNMVVRMLGLPEPPTPLDITDALAIAICHLHSHRLRKLGVGRR